MGALFGFIGKPDHAALCSMRDNLSHRGTECILDESENGSLGYWSRLQPSQRERHHGGLLKTGRTCVALAGFQAAAVGDQSMSLTEIESALESGPFPPEQLTGDFVIARIGVAGDLTLVRDGAGARTVYYAEHGDRFFFASEPKAIWSLAGFSRRIDANSLAKYLTFSFVPQTETMLEGVFELPAGHLLRRSADGSVAVGRYFVFEVVQRELELTDEDWVSQFKRVFAESIRSRLPANESPVVFLSGGLDSSIVTAEVVKQSRAPVRTFALHFGEKYPNELSFARSVADRLGTEHAEVLIRPKDFLPDLRKMIWHLDDPIGDPITMPNYHLGQHVRETTQWVFNGEGGDPCFGGPKNIPMLLEHWYGMDQERHFREKAYLASYRRGYEELDHVFTSDFRSKVEHASLIELLTPFFECDVPERFLDKLAAINIRLKGAHLILPKVERMLAAASLSPLSPLFSTEVVRLSFQIPSRLKLQNGIEKVILKRAYEGELPPEIIARPKSGMRVPVHFWFQGELKKYARYILSKREINRAGIFDHRRVKQLLDYNIEEGNGRYGIRLWMLITFEIWRRIVIEGEPV